jgi:hypothetical protein
MKFASAVFGVAAVLLSFAAPVRAQAHKDTILGVALSPAHIPNFSSADLSAFFDEAAVIGNHIVWICEWESMPPFGQIKAVHDMAVADQLKFHFYISPIALFGGRKNPAIPKSVGGTSFADPKVREAYKDEVLTLASLNPDVLGLATEVNFLAQNPAEYQAFVSLVHETYQAVKKKYPFQTVTISFQWDVMRAQRQFVLLKDFAGSVDTYSFTTYPDAFGAPQKVPADYYAAIREYLPSQRVGISEFGWSSAPPSSERAQAELYGRIPELMTPVRPEYVSLALLHDVALFTGELERLNHVGIRLIDDEPKPSWMTIVNLPEMH